MMMKNWLVGICSFCLAGALFAQSQMPASTQKKLDAMWDRLEYDMMRLSDFYWHEGQHLRLVRMLYVLVEVNPKNVETFSALGWVLDSYGNERKAFQIYDRGIAANPNDWDLYFDAGFWHFQKKNYQSALKYLQKAVSFKDAPPMVWKTLAHTYDRMGQVEKSLEIWEKLVKMDPEDGANKSNLERVKKKASGGNGT